MSSTPKNSYMIYDPKSKCVLAMLTGVSHYRVALKMASRGHKKVWVRKTGSTLVREYEGSKKKLTKPRVVMRKGEQIKFMFEPSTRLVQSFHTQMHVRDPKNVKKGVVLLHHDKWCK